jgi:hypothetical protein
MEYACFKIGVIHTPLDLRLRPPRIFVKWGRPFAASAPRWST